MSDEEKVIETEKYLIFYIGRELYGTPLLEVREVVEAQNIKPIPNVKSHFLGVTNLRGQIVGIVDLNILFNVQPNQDKSLRSFIVFDTEAGQIGASVDKVLSVEDLSEKDIEPGKIVGSKVPSQYFYGIAKQKDRLINLIKLRELLSDEEIESYRHSKFAGK
ncbi:MAG: chemotaxis protein CheW [Bdellovibrionales bacterium]